MIFKNSVDWVGRSPVDHQAGAILASHPLIWAIQHNEMYWPWKVPLLVVPTSVERRAHSPGIGQPKGQKLKPDPAVIGPDP